MKYKLNAAIIVDGNQITQWQRNALDEASDLLNVKIIFSCLNTNFKRNLFRYPLYYILNFLTLKNKLTRNVDLKIDNAKVIEFKSTYEGFWQRLPLSICRDITDSQINVIIKFGMSLLRIDDNLKNVSILSFHHGDPSQFRGRPAGFYEFLFGCSSVGVIVQQLSNKIDAGKVWSICHSKIFHYSYKKTVVNFYSNSQFMLRKALLNLLNNCPINITSNGNIYSLPGNILVLKFIRLIFFNKIRYLLYGVFFEKRWCIAIGQNIELLSDRSLFLKNYKLANVAFGYSFYADPFFGADGSIVRVEAMNSKNGLGEIIELDAKRLIPKKILLKANHYSYPFSFVHANKEYLLPEVASHSSPFILYQPFQISERTILKGLEKFRVVDSSIFYYQGFVFLFCGLISNSSDCLYLFSAESFDKEFKPHPLNPIVIDPSRARMAGRIICHQGNLYRFGQNNSFSYGNGITVCQITKLSTTDYEEKVVNSLCVNDAFGPHTFDTFEDNSVFDYYIDTFSFFAWYRRIAPIVLRYLKY